jgi:hypothetical protein
MSSNSDQQARWVFADVTYCELKIIHHHLNLQLSGLRKRAERGWNPVILGAPARLVGIVTKLTSLVARLSVWTAAANGRDAALVFRKVRRLSMRSIMADYDSYESQREPRR